MGGQPSFNRLSFAGVAVGNQIRQHAGLLPGRLEGFRLEINGNLTAAAPTTFSAPPQGAAAGGDDIDRAITSVINSITHRVDQDGQPMISAFVPANLRTLAQASLGSIRDGVTSSIANGAALAAVATPLTVTYEIPYKIGALDDGSLYEQGSIRCGMGQTEVNITSAAGALTLVSTVAATFTVTSMNLIPVYKAGASDQGAPGYVGPNQQWLLESNIAPVNGQMSDGTRILCLETNQLAYTASDVSVEGPGVRVQLASIAELGTAYQYARNQPLNNSTPDLALRATPLVYVERGSVSSDLPPPGMAKPQIQFPSAVTTLSLLSIFRGKISEAAVAQVKAAMPASKIKASAPRAAQSSSLRSDSVGVVVGH